MKKLFLFAYTAGLAIAMKLRKDSGKSKLNSRDPKKSTLDKVIDEVKDIHVTAYNEVKKTFAYHFEDVQDFESLKSKLSQMIDTSTEEVNHLIEKIKDTHEEKRAILVHQIEDIYQKKEELIEEARKKAFSFADIAGNTINSWMDEIKTKLSAEHEETTQKLDQVQQERKTPEKKNTSTSDAV